VLVHAVSGSGVVEIHPLVECPFGKVASRHREGKRRPARPARWAPPIRCD
jgi:hypothetical protein